MAIKGYFFNAEYNSETGSYDRMYNAEDVTGYLSALVGGGVIPNPSTSLQVTAGSGMQVNVGAGIGYWTDGRKMINTATLPLVVGNANSVNPRIDRVVMYCDYVNRLVGIEIVQGTPAATPVPPALVRNVSRYEYGLATIRVNADVSSITQSAITDTRADNTVCGWVTGLIDQVDTSTLFAQWQTAYEEFYADLEDWEADTKVRFDDWFETLTDELLVETYIKEYSKTSTFSGNGSKTVTCDMLGYGYENGDVFNVFINGLKLKDSEYTLNTSGASPTVTVEFTNAGSLDNEVTVQILQSRIGFSS